MSDTVTVYWSPIVKGTRSLGRLDDEVSGLRFFPPEQVSKTLDAKEFFGFSASRCPAITDELKKTFAIRCPIDYSAEIDYVNGNVNFGCEYTEQFNIDFIGPPNEERIHQLRYPAYLFFSEEPGLEITQLPAYYENNSFAKNTMMLTASYDIGSWVRQVLPAFKFRDTTTVDLKRGDIMMYYKFNTDKKIKLVQFDSDNHETRKIMESCLQYKGYKEKWWIPDKLAECYESFHVHSFRKRMLKIIEQNKFE